MSAVEIRELVKSYGRNGPLILKSLNLSIRPGEFTVLVGPSGCGKTTLLRLIAGLEEVTAGEIRMHGKVVNDLPPAGRDIGMVFQDYALYPHMSVRQNLSFGLQQRDLPKAEIEARIAEAAGLLGLTEFLERKPAQLSGGQRQRVAIGRALVKRPKIFLFDEPLSNLDAQLRSRTRVEIADLHRRFKSTSIYVTHDQVEAMTLADQIVLMERGRIRQVGTPEQVYERPANRFVAGFIGTPGMNFLEGEVVESKEGATGFRFHGMGERSAQTIRFALGEAPRGMTQADGRAVIGLRAEKIMMAEPSRGDIVARVSLLEPHGHETHVLAEVAPGLTWTLRVTGRVSLSAGDLIGLRFKRNDVHWFAADEEGERIDFDFLPTPKREISPPSVTYH